MIFGGIIKIFTENSQSAELINSVREFRMQQLYMQTKKGQNLDAPRQLIEEEKYQSNIDHPFLGLMLIFDWV